MHLIRPSLVLRFKDDISHTSQSYTTSPSALTSPLTAFHATQPVRSYTSSCYWPRRGIAGWRPISSGHGKVRCSFSGSARRMGLR
ncbi:hypothetical protein GJAV_G00002040 [Gymnothorax javanicus]|nr:hypothetical protein GJAV_G00002040 [Gymnothorax javanicus]